MTRRHRLLPIRLPRSSVWLLTLGAALVLFLAGSVVYAQFGQTVAQDQTVVERDQKLDLAHQVAAACASGQLAPTDRLCAKAAEVQAQPVAPIPGERGPGPTPEQIRAAVAEYLAVHPPADGRAPTAAEVAAAVAGYLTAHPPDPGRPPTAAEIASAVATYFASNPVRDGTNGDPGRPPTADEIASAVATYLQAHPPPAGVNGRDGATGPAGPGCPAGSTLQNVTYGDGTAGVGCVLDTQPTTDPPTPGLFRTN